MLNHALLKVLIVLTSHSQLGDTGKQTGYWLSETSHAYYGFRSAGLQVEFVSPKGGTPPIDPASMDLSDPLNRDFMQNSEVQAKLHHTPTPANIDPRTFKAIFFAGGHGVMWDFPQDKGLARIADIIYANGGIVAGVCHGVVGLVHVRRPDGSSVIQGKKVTGFSNEEERLLKLDRVVPFSLQDRLVKLGAKYTRYPVWGDYSLRDGRVITGQNPQSTTSTVAKIIERIQEDR